MRTRKFINIRLFFVISFYFVSILTSAQYRENGNSGIKANGNDDIKAIDFYSTKASNCGEYEECRERDIDFDNPGFTHDLIYRMQKREYQKWYGRQLDEVRKEILELFFAGFFGQPPKPGDYNFGNTPYDYLNYQQAQELYFKDRARPTIVYESRSLRSSNFKRINQHKDMQKEVGVNLAKLKIRRLKASSYEGLDWLNSSNLEYIRDGKNILIKNISLSDVNNYENTEKEQYKIEAEKIINYEFKNKLLKDIIIKSDIVRKPPFISYDHPVYNKSYNEQMKFYNSLDNLEKLKHMYNSIRTSSIPANDIKGWWVNHVRDYVNNKVDAPPPLKGVFAFTTNIINPPKNITIPEPTLDDMVNAVCPDCTEEQKKALKMLLDSGNKTLTGAEIKTIREELIEKDFDFIDKGELNIKIRRKLRYVNQRSLESKPKPPETYKYKTIGNKLCQFTCLSRELEFLGIPNPSKTLSFPDHLEYLRHKNWPLPNPLKKYKDPEDHPRYRTWHGVWKNVLNVFKAKYVDLGLGCTMNTKTRVIYSTPTRADFEGIVAKKLKEGKGVITSIKSHVISIQEITDEGIVVDDPLAEIDYVKRTKKGWDAYDKINSTSSESVNGENKTILWKDVPKICFKYIYSIEKK